MRKVTTDKTKTNIYTMVRGPKEEEEIMCEEMVKPFKFNGKN